MYTTYFFGKISGDIWSWKE